MLKKISFLFLLVSCPLFSNNKIFQRPPTPDLDSLKRPIFQRQPTPDLDKSNKVIIKKPSALINMCLKRIKVK